MGNSIASENTEINHDNIADVLLGKNESGEEIKPVNARKNRIGCYKARDAFYDCLEENDESLKEPKECLELYNAYQSSCPRSWIEYFDDRRHWRAVPLSKQLGENMNDKEV